MTQHELARVAGLPQPSIARIERGTVIPRTATLITILHATGYRLTVESISEPGDREAIRKRVAMAVPRRTREALGKPGRDIQTSPVQILRRLRRFGVPFVLMGELAEAAHGSPTEIGQSVEVCVASTDVARERLGLALENLGARGKGDRLHVLTETAAGDSYEVLNRNAVPMHVEAGILIRVAAIEDLIRTRRAGRAPGDQEAEATLRALLEEALTSRER
jgi:transcriptional regulator with XRE-family HTH domain